MTRLSRLLGERKPAVEVKPGHQFCRRRRDNITEMATVLGLRDEVAGIPHVRFELAYEEPSIGRVDAGLRVLALLSFIATYHQRVL